MPIYAYRCAACGHAKDVLQKMSDPLLSTCPACGAETLVKQVTAAGFQLKGSGWYVTDFKGSGAAPAAAGKADDAKPADESAAPAGADKPAAAADKATPATPAGSVTGSATGSATAASSPTASPKAPAAASSAPSAASSKPAGSA